MEAGFLPYYNRTNDIWALGVILINMVTSRSPWGKALTSDDCFCDFLLNENYLREMLPISKGANTLFRRIFAYEPSQRITIPALRKAIVDLDTFFMTDTEVARSPKNVRIAAAHCGVHVRPIRDAVEPKAAVRAAAAAPPRTPVIQLDTPAVLSPPASAHPFVGGDLSEASEQSSASDASLSSAESAGPVTPAQHAQDPNLEIPELDITLTDSGRSLWKRVIAKATPRSFGFGSQAKVAA